MELEHAFQQNGHVAALQMLVLGSLVAPGILGGSDMYRRFVNTIASTVVSFGPMALLVYILYRVSLVC